MPGSVDSFEYNEESLEKWLTDPEQFVPNNNMAFHLEKAGERRDIIAYLKKKLWQLTLPYRRNSSSSAMASGGRLAYRNHLQSRVSC